MLFWAGKWNKAFNGRKRRENAINGGKCKIKLLMADKRYYINTHEESYYYQL